MDIEWSIFNVPKQCSVITTRIFDLIYKQPWIFLIELQNAFFYNTSEVWRGWSEKTYAVKSAVQLVHVGRNVCGVGPFALADDVALRVCRPRGVGLVNANLLKRTVHQVDKADTEKRTNKLRLKLMSEIQTFVSSDFRHTPLYVGDS